MIYHVIPEDEWQKIKHKKLYTPTSLETDGFIHFSLIEQVMSIAFYVYKDYKGNLLILEVDEKLVKPKVLLEDLRGHGRFPHVYGPLNLDAVVAIYEIEKDTSERSKIKLKLPQELIKPTVDMKKFNCTNY